MSSQISLCLLRERNFACNCVCNVYCNVYVCVCLIQIFLRTFEILAGKSYDTVYAFMHKIISDHDVVFHARNEKKTRKKQQLPTFVKHFVSCMDCTDI